MTGAGAQPAARARTLLLLAATDLGAANATAVHVTALAAAFARAGWQVDVLAPRPASGSRAAVESALPGVRIAWAPRLGGRLALPGVNFVPLLWQVLRRRLRGAADIAYVRTGVGSCLPVLALRLLGNRRVVTEHNGWIADEAAELGHSAPACRLAAWSQLLDARASHVVRAVTPGLASLLAARGIAPGKLVAIGNGTDLDRQQPRPRDEALRRLGRDPARRAIGFIGNLAPWQGVGLAVEAFARLAARWPDWDLIVFGDGPDRDAIAAAAHRHGLAARVVMHGRVEPAEVSWALATLDVAVAPFTGSERNRRIGLSPLKVRDYAACGLPVVAADLPGVHELGGHGWLELHRPDDAGSLAGVLEPLLGDPDRRERMGRAARLFAEQHFGWDAAVSALARACGLDAGQQPET